MTFNVPCITPLETRQLTGCSASTASYLLFIPPQHSKYCGKLDTGTHICTPNNEKVEVGELPTV